MNEARIETQRVSDSRTGQRPLRQYEASFTAFWVVAGKGGRAYTRCLSEGGAFLETRERYVPGTSLEVEVFLDLGDEISSMCAHAEVIRCGRQAPCGVNGMEIRFVSMSDEAKQSLRRATRRLANLERIPAEEVE